MPRKKRAVAVFKEPKKKADFIIKVQSIVINVGGNSLFLSITPTKTVVDGRVNDLYNAEALVKTGTVGLAGDRDIKFDAVKTDMDDWKAFIQSLADHAPDYTTSVAIIHASGFGVKVNGVHVKAPFEAKNKKGAAGTVVLRMKAVKAIKGKTTYEWRWSDNNGISWTSMLSTGIANTEASGFASGKPILFQGRAIADKLASAWIAEGIVIT